MAFVVRPVSEADLAALVEIERVHLGRHGGSALVSAASLRYYARSGHAFVAERAGATAGFALGRASWDGASATVAVERLAVADGGDAALDALLAAVTKSAYDAGVYRIELRVPDGDASALERARAAAFGHDGTTLLSRTLGSRGG